MSKSGTVSVFDMEKRDEVMSVISSYSFHFPGKIQSHTSGRDDESFGAVLLVNWQN